jgi:hypothetical protein
MPHVTAMLWKIVDRIVTQSYTVDYYNDMIDRVEIYLAISSVWSRSDHPKWKGKHVAIDAVAAFMRGVRGLPSVHHAIAGLTKNCPTPRMLVY